MLSVFPHLPLISAVAIAIHGPVHVAADQHVAAVDTPTIELRIARTSPAPGFVPMEAITPRADSNAGFVREDNIVSDDGMEAVTVTRTATGLVIDIQFSRDAAVQLVEAVNNIGSEQRLAVIIKSRVAVAAPVLSPILDGHQTRLQIGLELPAPAAEEISRLIAARWP